MKKNTKPFLQKKGNAIHLNRVHHARTFSQRFMGLMGQSPGEFDYALIFHLAEKGALSASIHMLFMRMPIDVLWLDERQRIVDHVENLAPWTLNCTPRAPAKYVIELPAGTIGKEKLKSCEKIVWI